MKLSVDAIIAPAKMTDYLLKWRPENDKSELLAQMGYDVTHADRLAEDIRHRLLPLEAIFEEATEYGDKYRITGVLVGPNGRSLKVASFWMVEGATGVTKFLTLYPAKEG